MKTKRSKLMSGKSKSGRIMLSCLLIATMVLTLIIPQTAQTASFAATEIGGLSNFMPKVVQGNPTSGYTGSPHPAGPNLGDSTKVGYAGHEWVIIGYNGNGVASSANQATLLLSTNDSYAGTSIFYGNTSDSNANQYTTSVLKTTYTALIGAGSAFIDTSDATNGAVLTKETSNTYLVPRNLDGGSGLLNYQTNAEITSSDTLATVASGASATQYMGAKRYVGTGTTFDWYAYQAYRATNPNPYTGGGDADKVAGSAVNTQPLWPLSFAEASLLDNSIRIYKISWWLRSPGNYTSSASIVNSVGNVSSANGVTNPYGVRPALNLNLQSVIFTSAATGANSKSSQGIVDGFVGATTPTSGDKIKFTMLDTTGQLKPTVTITSPTTPTNLNPLELSYNGATTGTNQYLSAVLRDTNTNEVVYYAKLKDTSSNSDGSGTVSVPLDYVLDGDYKLEVFSEQINGENNTDFCSDLLNLGTITVGNIPPTLSKESATRTSISDATVKFTSDEDGMYYYQIDGTPPTATSLIAAGSNATTLTAAEQTLPLSSLTSGAHTIYIVAKDAAGYASNLLTIDIPQEKIFKVIEHFGTHVLGSNKGAEAKIDYANYEDMTGLFYDGKEISKEYYKVSSGSTVITLDAAYLNRFKVGTYDKFVAEFKDGSSELITLRITSGVPGTGDDTSLTRIVAIACLALLCLFVIQVAMVIKMRRRKVRA